MTHQRRNEGVCSLSTTVRLQGGIVQEVEVLGGCDGNLKGVCALLRGRNALEAADLLEGMTCGDKSTSCPSEIAKCLREAVAVGQEAS